jgi:dTDP-glucose 4,6-dehydratase
MKDKVKFVIFGGTGFLGRSLVDNLINENNNHIYVITRNKDKAKLLFSKIKSSNFHIEECDVNNLQNLLELKLECDYAVNFASDSTNGPKLEKLVVISQMIQASNNILLWANKNVKVKYLYASSGAVYKDKDKSETVKLDLEFKDLANAYANTKLLCEELCKTNSEINGLDYIITRIFAVAGWHIPTTNHYAFGNFLNSLLNKENIVLNSDGKSLRSYIDQRDFASTIKKLLLKDVNQKIYNIGSEEKISIFELANKFSKFGDLDITVNDLKKTELRSNYIPNLDRVKKEKILSQEYNLDDTIIDSYKKLLST